MSYNSLLSPRVSHRDVHWRCGGFRLAAPASAASAAAATKQCTHRHLTACKGRRDRAIPGQAHDKLMATRNHSGLYPQRSALSTRLNKHDERNWSGTVIECCSSNDPLGAHSPRQRHLPCIDATLRLAQPSLRRAPSSVA